MSDLKNAVVMSGIVARFKGNGRKLGYPTANIAAPTDLPDGVYFGFATLGEYKNHPAMIFIGTPTTVGDTVRRVEAYLVDIADRDYYGMRLSLSIEKFHRANETFASVDELVKNIKKDETAARSWFSGR
jgi:riboflavin kinase/FMN adenylyltransferase